MTKQDAQKSSGDQVLNCGELKVDLLKREFMINSEIIHLTNNELNLVVYFKIHCLLIKKGCKALSLLM